MANPVLAKTNFGQSNLGQSISGSGVYHGGPQRVARRVGLRRVGRPKISRFFPSPATISLFLSLWVYFGGVSEDPDENSF